MSLFELPKNTMQFQVGNKCDLRGDKKVDSKSGENLATELGCHFYESSAKGETD